MKTEIRKIFSKRLNRDVDIEGYEYNGMFLALHYSLEKLVSEINLTDNIRLSVNINNPVVINNGSIPYIIYTGYVSDGDTTIPCNGDAFEMSLNNDISRQYPGEMAFKRCYDRGVLTWLYLQPEDNKKIYSDSEIDVVKMLDSSPEIKKEDFISLQNESETVLEQKTEDVSASYVIENDTPVMQTETVESTVVEQVTEETKSTVSSELEDIVITEGKYKKNPKQISEIVKTDIGIQWLTMAIKNNWIPDENRRNIINKWIS